MWDPTSIIDARVVVVVALAVAAACLIVVNLRGRRIVKRVCQKIDEHTVYDDHHDGAIGYRFHSTKYFTIMVKIESLKEIDTVFDAFENQCRFIRINSMIIHTESKLVKHINKRGCSIVPMKYFFICKDNTSRRSRWLKKRMGTSNEWINPDYILVAVGGANGAPREYRVKAIRKLHR